MARKFRISDTKRPRIIFQMRHFKNVFHFSTTVQRLKCIESYRKLRREKQERNIPHFKSRTKNVLFAFGVKIVKKFLGLENISLKNM